MHLGQYVNKPLTSQPTVYTNHSIKKFLLFLIHSHLCAIGVMCSKYSERFMMCSMLFFCQKFPIIPVWYHGCWWIFYREEGKSAKGFKVFSPAKRCSAPEMDSMAQNFFFYFFTAFVASRFIFCHHG